MSIWRILLLSGLFSAFAMCSSEADLRDNERDPKYNAGGDGADLIVTAFTYPATVNQGDSNTYTITVKNNGNVDATSTFKVCVDSNSDEDFLDDAFWYSSSDGSTSVSSLAQGVETTVTVSHSVVISSYDTVGAYADCGEVISEATEGNNYKTGVITVQ